MVSEMAVFYLINRRVKHNAMEALRNAAAGWRVSITAPKRSQQQNDKLWAVLGDIANAAPEGRQWEPETWKCAFMHALGHQVRFCEGLDGSGPFPMGFRSSKLDVAQMSDLITCALEYGDRHGVKWKETIRGGFMEDAA